MREIIYYLWAFVYLILAHMSTFKGNIPLTIIDCTMILVFVLLSIDERRKGGEK